MSSSSHIQLLATAILPTRFGRFMLYGFLDVTTKEEISAIAAPSLEGLRHRSDVPIRIHSACHTGDTLSSMRCDCQRQLHTAQRYISRRRCGIIIYLPQEGRGIGLINKIQAYHLQDQGKDTAEANTELGFEHDLRDYRAAAAVIQHCGIESIVLLTNNPDKIRQMESSGITVTRRVPLRMKRNRYNRSYLQAKKEKFHHDT